MKKFRKILLFLGITQKIINERGYERHRLNPYNPLSYLTLIISLIVMGLYGFMGALIEILKGNPFKYR
jgi:hypothetical protein